MGKAIGSIFLLILSLIGAVLAGIVALGIFVLVVKLIIGLVAVVFRGIFMFGLMLLFGFLLIRFGPAVCRGLLRLIIDFIDYVQYKFSAAFDMIANLIA